MIDFDLLKALNECPRHDNCYQCPFEETGCDLGQLCDEATNVIKTQKNELLNMRRRLKGILPIVADLKENTVKEFAKFLIDKAENGVVSIADLPDFVIEFQEVGAVSG